MTEPIYIHIDAEKTGKNLDRLLKEKGIRKAQVGDVIGVNFQAVYKWIYGACLPKVDNLIALSLLLDESIEDILVWERVS